MLAELHIACGEITVTALGASYWDWRQWQNVRVKPGVWVATPVFEMTPIGRTGVSEIVLRHEDNPEGKIECHSDRINGISRRSLGIFDRKALARYRSETVFDTLDRKSVV